MSRSSQKPIPLPGEVKVGIGERDVVIQGPLGELRLEVPRGFMAAEENGALMVKPTDESARPALWGTLRALLANMVLGVTKGFEKRLEIEGIGYQARVQDGNLVIEAGFTNPVAVRPVGGIVFTTERNVIIVKGLDKQLVGQMAAMIRAVRKPEPYKGKGIRYQGEIIRRKAGKKAVSAA